MATTTVPDMTARSSAALSAANDFFYLTTTTTDERLNAGLLRDYNMAGIKGGTGLDATVDTTSGVNDTTLDLNITGLPALGATTDAADQIALYDADAGSIKKATIAEVVGAATSAVTSVSGGTNLTASPTTGATVVNLDATLTGLTSVTSTDFVGDLTGDVTGNVSGTAATVTGATQAAITSAANLATIGTVTSGTLSTGAVVAGVTMTLGSDAEGDVYYRNASGVLTRLAVGTDADVLTLASGIPSWATPTTGDLTAVLAGTGITVTNGTGPEPTVALTNTSVSYGGVSVALGSSDATPAFDLADATNYEGTAILSTGVTGTTKFLRVDGDNSSSWQVPPDTNTTYTAGDGLDLSGTEFSTDLKSNGGVVIESAELAVDLGASSITGTLDVGDGGTGISTIAKGSVLVANAADTISAASGVTDGHVLTYTSSSDTVGWSAVPSSGDPAGTAVAMAIALGG